MSTAPQSARNTLLVIGCGDLGSAVARHFVEQGWDVCGVRRSAADMPGVRMVRADVTQPATLAALREIAADFVLIALTPGGFSDERYRAVYVDGLAHLLDNLNRTRLRRLVWVSSTSVFEQDDGSALDENCPAHPASFSGRRLLEAEQLLARANLPHTCVRFGGIYGPGRDRLLQQLRSGRRSPAQPQKISNRIHRDDAVGMLQFLLQCAADGVALDALYLGVDTAPTPIAEVERWFAHYLHLDYDAMTVAAGEARGGNKSCSSARVQALGYRFNYPTYREGLPTLLQHRSQD
jgi:nucleoside-diphosphate-sugar epimerase